MKERTQRTNVPQIAFDTMTYSHFTVMNKTCRPYSIHSVGGPSVQSRSGISPKLCIFYDSFQSRVLWTLHFPFDSLRSHSIRLGNISGGLSLAHAKIESFCVARQHTMGSLLTFVNNKKTTPRGARDRSVQLNAFAITSDVWNCLHSPCIEFLWSTRNIAAGRHRRRNSYVCTLSELPRGACTAITFAWMLRRVPRADCCCRFYVLFNAADSA